MKAFPIDFVRQTLEQTLLEEHLKNPGEYAGGDSQISIKSFYEQVQTREQVDRFVESFRDLENQQNRSGLIGNGIISLAENPTITNIRKGLIVPMTWNCIIRCTLEDRDLMVNSINNMISKLKGHKVDIAEFEDGQTFKVGTIGNNSRPSIQPMDYIGEIDEDEDINQQVVDNLSYYKTNYGIYTSFPTGQERYFYATGNNGQMLTIWYDNSDNKYKLLTQPKPNVILAPQDIEFTQYKLSLSFDSIRTDEPKTLNGKEYMYISFSGSATLVSSSIRLGNDLQFVSFVRNKIVADTDISLGGLKIYLDPLELPNANSISTKINHIVSNGFTPNSHADTVSPTIQYTFVFDESEMLLRKLFEYSRYGIISATSGGISPNMIFDIVELWCSWGEVNKYTFLGKIVESVNVENTESDVMTLQITIQIQGGNN